MDRTGQTLGNYLIQRQLGSGGFADVYLGEQIYMKNLAAIKVLLAKFDAGMFPQFQGGPGSGKIETSKHYSCA